MLKKYLGLYKYIGKYKKEQILMSMLCMLAMGVAILIPYLMAIFINRIQEYNDFNSIINITVIIAIVSLIASILNTIQNYIWHRFKVRFVNHIRVSVFKEIINKKLVYFKENKSGDILSKILYDTNSVAEHIAIGIPMLLINIFRLLGVFIFMGMINVKLTLIVLIIAPIYCGLFNIINKHLRENSGKEREAFSKVTSDVQDYLGGISTIKILKKENYFKNKFVNSLNNYENFNNKNLLFRAVSYGTTDIIINLLPVTILFVGSIFISKGTLKIGSLIAFYTYLNYIYEPINNLSDWFVGVQTTLGMSSRITDLLETDKDYLDNEGIYINEINSIQFKDVSFSYNNNLNVINNLSFKIEKGDKVAIVGASGTGKSTILQLLMKVYNEYTGDILINGISLKNINRSSIYDRISLVEQNMFIFNGTIRENIIFDDNRKIEESLNISNCSDFIKDFDKGLDEVLLEGGKNISGGQMQRICICRALEKKFDTLILDEATSALDKVSEEKVINNINDYIVSNNKILITISHRDKPVSICNKVINLNLK